MSFWKYFKAYLIFDFLFGSGDDHTYDSFRWHRDDNEYFDHLGRHDDGLFGRHNSTCNMLVCSGYCDNYWDGMNRRYDGFDF